MCECVCVLDGVCGERFGLYTIQSVYFYIESGVGWDEWIGWISDGYSGQRVRASEKREAERAE